MHCNENRLRIKKRKMIDNELQDPQNNESYIVRVESCSSRRYYRLSEANHFCVELEHLSNDTLCVYEDMVGNEVLYIVDGVIKNEGCVDYTDASYHEVILVNVEDSVEYGSLCLNKQVKSLCGDVIDTNVSFTFEILGNNFYKSVVLNRENNYQVCIENIPYGNYEVREVSGSMYDVIYKVNGIESMYGNIEINSPYGEMYIENYKKDEMHVMRISKWLYQDGKLLKPSYPNAYDIRVDDGYAMREYTLACNNRYAIELEGNYMDHFVVEEITGSNVRYEVDGVFVDSVDVQMDQDHEIRIINGSSEKGSIFIQKWIKEDGRLQIPNPYMSFQVQIIGLSDMVYTLNNANDFTLLLEDVEAGNYEVQELGDMYDVTYEIHGQESMHGQFVVTNTQRSTINIINSKKVNNYNLQLKKQMHDSSGNIVDVENGVYEIVVESDAGMQIYALNNENMYEKKVEVEAGWYRIYEKNESEKTHYIVDGVDHHEIPYIYIDERMHEVVISNLKSTIFYQI